MRTLVNQQGLEPQAGYCGVHHGHGAKQSQQQRLAGSWTLSFPWSRSDKTVCHPLIIWTSTIRLYLTQTQHLTTATSLQDIRSLFFCGFSFCKHLIACTSSNFENTAAYIRSSKYLQKVSSSRAYRMPWNNSESQYETDTENSHDYKDIWYLARMAILWKECV